MKEDKIVITLKRKVLSDQMEKIEDKIKELLMSESVAAEVCNTVTHNEQIVTYDDIEEWRKNQTPLKERGEE